MRLALLFVLVGLAACGARAPVADANQTVTDGVIFRVDRTEVGWGKTVTATIVNESRRTLSGGLLISGGPLNCAVVETREGSRWVDRRPPEGCGWPFVLIQIGPSGTAEQEFGVGETPGLVRIVHGYEVEGRGTVTLVSPPIRVR